MSGRDRAAPVIWEPAPERTEQANLSRYLAWLAAERSVACGSYEELWRWSVSDLEAFWSSLWDFFGVRASPRYEQVLSRRVMPGARWFPGAKLNYAEHALVRRDDHPALVARSESRGLDGTSVTTYAELARDVAAVRAGLQRLGVGRGDRVVAYVPNIPEAVIGFLAAASLGAIWSSCSPDFGTHAVVDRFRQLEPTVLLAVDGYRYNGRDFDRRSDVAEIGAALPTLRATVSIPYLSGALPDTVTWEELGADRTAELAFEQVPFDHPLWVLFSSGTTGLPKGIVHGHGGILLEHLKSLALHNDIGESDRFFWFTTTGWMMWNYLVGSLTVGATIVLYDGSPSHPDFGTLWRLAEETRITVFGTSAPFLHACMKDGIVPRHDFDLSRVVTVGSTGAPLAPEGFEWIRDAVGPDVLPASVSGGTDMCTAFLQSCPLLPVRAGELQCRGLGAKIEAFDLDGRPLVGEVGELVITEPMPSMPVCFWNDPDDSRYRESYFDVYPGVWRHGDWIELTPEGGAVVYGRSDATLNRGGVRMGTSEFYRVVEEIPEVQDSLVVDLGAAAADGKLVLFLVVAPAADPDAVTAAVRTALRSQLSPRHLPDDIHIVPAIPHTLNGKRLEVPMKRILAGTPIDEAVNRDTISDPDALDAIAHAFAAATSSPSTAKGT